uniref:Uncharacterized protein n=1 Tax=Cacopsylla melanoneura TaxID=428564 RepID=A0A8D8LL71_9HEMI
MWQLFINAITSVVQNYVKQQLSKIVKDLKTSDSEEASDIKVSKGNITPVSPSDEKIIKKNRRKQQLSERDLDEFSTSLSPDDDQMYSKHLDEFSPSSSPDDHRYFKQ